MLWGTSVRTSASQGFRARRYTRYRTPDLTCPLGQVIDLSASGARIRGRGVTPFSRGSTVQITLSDSAHTHAVVGRVAWTRRSGLTRFEMGVQFVGLTKDDAAAIAKFAKFGFFDKSAKLRPHRARQICASAQVEDLYAILGLEPDAHDEQIRQTYEILARRFQAATRSSPHAERRILDIEKAYAVLGNRARRRRYDQLLARCAA